MSSKIPVYPKTERERTNDAYIKQMRPSAPGYVPLWDPTPMRDIDWDEVQIGDVGRVTQGYFRRLFNVTVPRSHLLNGGRIPDNFITLDFDSEKDTEVEYTSPVITPRTPFFGDHLTCETLSGQELDSERSSRYKITKHEKGTSFVLLAPQDLIMERTLKQNKLDAWKEYAERHYQNWVNYAEDMFAAKVKSEELILVRGWVKTPKWVIATLHRRGVYELYVDLADELSATLTFGGKDVSEDTQLGEVRFGCDVFGMRADMVREMIRSIDRPLPDCFRDGDPCTRCLFVKGLKVENSFWTPRRVVAAAEPQDPGLDGPGRDRFKVRAMDREEEASEHDCDALLDSGRQTFEWRLRSPNHLLPPFARSGNLLRSPFLLPVSA